MYPVWALFPAIVGALVAFKLMQGGDNDFISWIALIGANVMIFARMIIAVSRSVLFFDPALERLKVFASRK